MEVLQRQTCGVDCPQQRLGTAGKKANAVVQRIGDKGPCPLGWDGSQESIKSALLGEESALDIFQSQRAQSADQRADQSAGWVQKELFQKSRPVQ